MSLRKYYPKSGTDALCMTFTLIAFPTVIIHGCFYLLPTLVRTDSVDYKINVVALLFIWLNVVWNYSKALTVDMSTKQLSLPVVAQDGWHYCYWCQAYSPSRSRHCPLCNICVVRRDHHCYFTGRCIGLQNHRYFIMFLIYTMIGSLYGFILSITVTIHINNGISFWMLVSFVLPVLAGTFGQLPVNPVVAFLTSCSIATFLASLGYLCLQFVCIRRGQTYFEWRCGILAYDKGWIVNLKELLGRNMWFIWIAPFVPSPLLTDGSDYPVPPAVQVQHDQYTHVARGNGETGPPLKGKGNRKRVY